jgi:hypothetical protein
MPATLRLPAPPARRPSANPASDPRFKVVKDRLTKGSSNLKKHPPAAKKALEAQKAALPPAKEKLVGAQANQVDTMQEAKAKKPDPNSFLALLRAEIEKVMPKNLDQADNFMEGGEQQQMKGAVTSKVDAQKQEASGEIKSATDQAPDQSKVVGKVVTPIPGEPTPVMPGINAGEGMPQARPEADVSQQQNKKNADQQMADAEVTPQQMQKANDPRFSSVLAAKTNVEKVADAAPAKYRTGEKSALAKAVVGAQSQSKLGISALLGVKTKSGTAVKSRQQIAKEKDEARRKEVGDNIEKIYNQTKLNVEAKLASLETDVSRLFDAGANAAIDNMKNNSRREIEKFKDDRYSGIRGWGRWIADRFRDVPPEIKQILQRNRAKFTQEMDTLVVRIANVVETRLQQAKNEITQGQGRIKSYVAGLPKDLQAVGKAAEKEMAGRFEELQQGIEDRKNALAQKLAQQYKEASDKADKALQEIEDENRSALYGFIAKLAEIVKILLEFKNKLMSILRKGWETIKLILADPIGFLSNLISAIKGGFEAFVSNIWEHLKKGFMKWLFGALAGAGIEIPSDLSLPSILKLVLSVLGITYEKMRAKAVKLLGPTAVAVIEKVVEYVRTLVTGGPAALWEKIKEDLSNLKEMVIDAIQNWLITTIVKQAVTKIVSMFNPAGAIVQAVLMIYNVVMFVVERAAQIMEFVEAVINSVHQIATGAIGTAVSWIERALANMIPIMIGFLASLIGLGGISAKIKEFILKVQTKVDLAIDKMIGKAVGWVKKAFGAAKAGVKAAMAWWTKKKRFKAGDESHELSFNGEKSNATLMVASNPKAVDAYVKEIMAASPTDEQKKAAVAISPLLTKIKAEMKKKETEQDADLIASLFENVAVQLSILMGLPKDGQVSKLSVPSRRKWEIDTLESLQKDQPGDHKKALGSKGQPLVKKGKARRHIVSSKDIAEHYEKALNSKKWSIAKVLLEKSGSGEAPTPVDKKVNNEAIHEATKKRHLKFFNSVDNLFVGPSRKNSALGRRFDPERGGFVMTPKEIDEYINSVKKNWALDGSFKATR